jgi:hypothetical protein
MISPFTPLGIPWKRTALNKSGDRWLHGPRNDELRISIVLRLYTRENPRGQISCVRVSRHDKSDHTAVQISRESTKSCLKTRGSCAGHEISPLSSLDAVQIACRPKSRHSGRIEARHLASMARFSARDKTQRRSLRTALNRAAFLQEANLDSSECRYSIQASTLYSRSVFVAFRGTVATVHDDFRLSVQTRVLELRARVEITSASY